MTDFTKALGLAAMAVGCGLISLCGQGSPIQALAELDLPRLLRHLMPIVGGMLSASSLAIHAHGVIFAGWSQWCREANGNSIRIRRYWICFALMQASAWILLVLGVLSFGD